jgi:hypothetical protein
LSHITCVTTINLALHTIIGLEKKNVNLNLSFPLKVEGFSLVFF